MIDERTFIGTIKVKVGADALALDEILGCLVL